MKIEQRLVEWEYKVNELKLLKAEEAKMRRELCGELVRDSESTEGSIKTDFRDFVAVVTAKVNRNVDDSALTAILNDLSDDERACIVYKPQLDLRRYRKLPEDSILHSAITESPGMPTLKLDWIPED